MDGLNECSTLRASLNPFDEVFGWIGLMHAGCARLDGGRLLGLGTRYMHHSAGMNGQIIIARNVLVPIITIIPIKPRTIILLLHDRIIFSFPHLSSLLHAAQLCLQLLHAPLRPIHPIVQIRSQCGISCQQPLDCVRLGSKLSN